MTLAQLRDAVRQRSDMERTQFIKDPELTAYINGSYGELYDILVSRFEDYYSEQVSFSLASGVSTYALPADFYKMRGLDYQVSAPDDWETVRPLPFGERNTRNRTVNRLIYGVRPINYRILGGSLKFFPESQADGSYRMFYIPRFTPLAADGDVMGDVLDFEEYVIVDAAIKCVVKEESDPQALMLQKQQLRERIQAMASNRDAGDPERITDVSFQTNEASFFFPRS